MLMGHFGRVTGIRVKENQSSIVTEADLASERFLLEQIRARFPEDGIVAEESGYVPGSTGQTWVVDPLDGTSNFAAGIPWFGVLVTLLRGTEPVLAGGYLPVPGVMYLAEPGGGAWRDGEPVRVAEAADLKEVLCAFGMDASAKPRVMEEQGRMAAALVRRSRNLRATNSLVDFCYTIDGRLGGCVNLSTRIWDIAGAALLVREAGGVVTDIDGGPLALELGKRPQDRVYTIVAGSPGLHSQILRAIQAARGESRRPRVRPTPGSPRSRGRRP